MGCNCRERAALARQARQERIAAKQAAREAALLASAKQNDVKK